MESVDFDLELVTIFIVLLKTIHIKKKPVTISNLKQGVLKYTT